MNLINIEIKARCGNPEGVREALRARNAHFAGADHQVDTYFRVPEGRLKLRQGNIENALIAYRRPNQAGPKTSEVALAPVANGDDLRGVLERSLGVLVAVDKQREIYYVDNVKFHIDQVEGLGGFVEIEACGTADGDREPLLAQCRQYMELFGIRDEDLVEKSYSDLLMEKRSGR
jgi:adenylate cyclase, class 2